MSDFEAAPKLESVGLRLDRRTLYFDKIPRGLKKKRLLFAADIHMSWMFKAPRVERLLRDIEALAPDLILWGGDYAETYDCAVQFFQMTNRLHPPMGMYGVPGNNDAETFRGDMSELRRVMRRGGVRLLVNRTAHVDIAGGRLVIAGADDIKHGAPSGRMLRLGAEKGDFRILLSHAPQALDQILDRVRELPALTLCGHTHGGQIRLGPITPYTFFFEHTQRERSRYFHVSGYHVVDGMPLLITNGVGTSRLPIRIGAPAQIHLLTLDQK